MTTITNHHKSPIAVGGVFIPAGGSADVENWDAIKDRPIHKTWLAKKVISVVGAKKSAQANDGDGDKTPAEILAMADGNFMAFKSAASKLLGDATPSKKDDIVAALEDLATKPE